MKRKKEEVVPADASLRKTVMILAAAYVLLLLWLEPLIDFLLMQQPLERSHEAIEVLNQKKAYAVAVAFGVMRSLPILLFLWFGFQVMTSQRLPPKGMRMPFAVRVMEGVPARTAGMALVAVALMLLFPELMMIINAPQIG